MNRLMLCAGTARREGWKRLDASPVNQPDILARIPPLPPEIHTKAWDEIEWVHGITSLYPWEAQSILTELRSVLAAGGKLVLEQPDFRLATERVEWLFGDPSHREPLIMNKWAYSPLSLEAMLREAGFSRIGQFEAEHHMPERDFRMEAYA